MLSFGFGYSNKMGIAIFNNLWKFVEKEKYLCYNKIYDKRWIEWKDKF